MPKYQKNLDQFTVCKAITYLKNFLTNHSEDIENPRFFSVIAQHITPEQIERTLRRECTPEQMKSMLEYRTRQDRLDWEDEPEEQLREFWCCAPKRTLARKVLSGICDEILNRLQRPSQRRSAFEMRWNALCDFLNLSDLERDVLLVHHLLSCDLLNGCSRANESIFDFIAQCIDRDIASVIQCHSNGEKLATFHCVVIQHDNQYRYNGIFDAYLNGTRKEILGNDFYRPCCTEELPWDYFTSITEKHGEILTRCIAANLGKKPVNILFYGAPGTGKTSFAAALAKKLNLKAWSVAQAQIAGNMSNEPDFRFTALVLTDKQLGVNPGNLMIVDEADAMLLFDKGLLNDTMLKLRTPVIWITNTPPEMMEESTRRRFDYSISFAPLSAAQRLSIWQNNVQKLHLEALLNQSMLQTLAERYEVSAGGITLVLQNLANMAPEKSEVLSLIDKLIAPHCELIGKSAEPDKKTQVMSDYSLDGLSIKSDIPLAQLVSASRRFYELGENVPDRPRMNLLFSGAPGTGKTEFAKYLAQQLKRKLMIRMGSDLLSMFVGGTEKNLRKAFQEAEAEHAILFLDEIDGMLQDRNNAVRSWEVTQVNELLHQMENFNGIMIGATNFMARLDAAVMRRFTFKVEFDYLDDAGKCKFFERMFQSPLTNAEAAELSAIARLTPGDFRTVRQSLFYLGDDADNHARLQALRRESDAKMLKEKGNAGKIGF